MDKDGDDECICDGDDDDNDDVNDDNDDIANNYIYYDKL